MPLDEVSRPEAVSSPSTDPPQMPPIITYAKVMFNPDLPMEQRVAAAKAIYENYGEQGREIAWNWLEAQRLAQEASTWHQVTHHFYSSWQAGPDAPKYVGGAMIAVSLGTIACVAGGCAAVAGAARVAAGAASAGAAKVAQLADRASTAGRQTVTSASASSIPYNSAVLTKAAQDPRFHDFPRYLNNIIMSQGTYVEKTSTYGVYRLSGFLNGAKGVFEVGVDTIRYGDPTITHRFFRPIG